MEAAASRGRPSRAYWICQALGWSLYVIVTFFQARTEDPLPRAIVEPLFSASLGLGLTHVSRRILIDHGWLRLGAAALAPRVVIASLLLAAIQVAVLEVVEVGIYGDPASASVSIFAIMRWSRAFFIWFSIYFGHSLLQQRQESELRGVRAEQALQAAELRALRSQLNPHFLFNSLNTIRALVAEEPKLAQDAITRIAKVLRYSLGSGREQTVVFERELEAVKDYLALEALRLQERLHVEWDIANDVRQIPIPIMLLQILVENAIKHGVAQLPRGGTVGISANVVKDTLEVEVVNPRPREPSYEDETPGVGMKNVSERLDLLFGSDAQVVLDLSIAERAIARVRIPIASRR